MNLLPPRSHGSGIFLNYMKHLQLAPIAGVVLLSSTTITSDLSVELQSLSMDIAYHIGDTGMGGCVWEGMAVVTMGDERNTVSTYLYSHPIIGKLVD